MTKNVQIREVSDETLAALKTRAAQEGMSLSAYLRGQLDRMASRPTLAELLLEADELRATTGGVTTDDIVAIQREIRGQ
ncbi:FitA-like ribbon-helix-helix domain-containing protein [Glycomyces dulcitolivorans]|jgi:plasmid stability protein|uniref:FitA-like ribbon-helix-helix domain-containing protein n=1 Tax=Glycomyces dulcitolivorans TaxID=2200759 RepID=UPI000DD2C567|nr:antitoxin [Glycomyces dulcitolivorans]